MNILTKTIYGEFFVDPVYDKKMSGQLARGKHPNAALVELARQFTGKESVVLDIGAHIGTFAIPISRSVARVVAFEPSAETFATLKRNALQNSCDIDTRNKALGARAGQGSMAHRNAANAGAHSLVPGSDVAIGTLDQEVPRADFIKIDVEGMEAEVFAGGAALIERCRPVIFFELNLSQLRAHGASPRQLARFFTARGYRLYLPIEKREGSYELARVRGLTLITALIAPRAWALRTDSAPFDILAVPRECKRGYCARSVGYAAAYAIGNNLAVKARRLTGRYKKV